MELNPKVSIMIPTFNQAGFINRAVESALAQDYPNLEIIVSDDCSSDHTADVIKEYLSDPRLKYSRNAKNLGRVNNYRHVLRDLATGEWAINLDGDDFYIDNHFISYAVSLIALQKERCIAFVQTSRYNKTLDRLNEEGRPIVHNIDKEEILLQGGEFFFDFEKYFISHLNTLYNRRLALLIDFYRYDITSADVESILRLALHGDVLLSKRITAVWVEHGHNTVKQRSLKSLDRNLLWIEGAYCEAKNLGHEMRALFRWKRRLTFRYLENMFLWGLKTSTFRQTIAYLWIRHRWFLFSARFFRKAFLYILKRAGGTSKPS